MVRDFTIECPGARLRGDAAGGGRTVVMLHAGVADRRMWRDALPHLGARWQAVAYDRRGFGETTAANEPFRHIDDLHAVIAASGGGAAVLIGCSQGGRIAIDYTLAHAGKVAALILVGTAITGAPSSSAFPEAVAAAIAELEEAEEKGDLERVNAIEARLWLDGPLAAEGRVSGAVRQLFLDMNGVALRHPPLTRETPCPSAMGRLAEIGAPTLVVCGDLDFPDIQQRSALIAQTIPDARALTASGCAHLPNLEQPVQFNRVVEAFLGEVL